MKDITDKYYLPGCPPLLNIRVIEIDGQPRVFMEVDGSDSYGSLRERTGDALAWRDWVTVRAEVPARSGIDATLQILYERHDAGESFADLAREINRGLAKHLKDYARFREKLGALWNCERNAGLSDRARHELALTEYQKGNLSEADSLAHLAHWLYVGGFKWTEIGGRVEEALEDIRIWNRLLQGEGRYPISPIRLKYRLNNWRKSRRRRRGRQKSPRAV